MPPSVPPPALPSPALPPSAAPLTPTGGPANGGGDDESELGAASATPPNTWLGLLIGAVLLCCCVCVAFALHRRHKQRRANKAFLANVDAVGGEGGGGFGGYLTDASVRGAASRGASGAAKRGGPWPIIRLHSAEGTEREPLSPPRRVRTEGRVEWTGQKGLISSAI